MSLPYSSAANLPQGGLVVEINSVNYVVPDPGEIPKEVTRLIQRTDENGDRGDFQLRKSSERITFSMTLQRETTSTALPTSGQNFTANLHRDGSINLVVSDVGSVRSGTDFDTIPISVVVED